MPPSTLFRVCLISLILLGVVGCEEGAWKRAEESNTLESLETFVSKYPDSPYVTEAQQRIDIFAWQEAALADQIDSYAEYITRHPMGGRIEDAAKAIARVGQEQGRVDEAVEVLARLAGSIAAEHPFAKILNGEVESLLTLTAFREWVVLPNYEAEGQVLFGSLEGEFEEGTVGASFQGTYHSTGENRLPQIRHFGVYLGLIPGITHRFTGEVYLPAPGEAIRLSGNINGSGESNSEGNFVFTGPIDADGTIHFNEVDTPHFVIRVPAEKHLDLLLTAAGYRYLEGTGTLTYPDGSQRSF